MVHEEGGAHGGDALRGKKPRPMGVECHVVAPSLIPRRPGDRVKTDRRDARQLARLLRSGDLTPVWVPDEEHEALRDLVRAREDARQDRSRKIHQLDKFLLRNGVRPPDGVRAWTTRHRQWLQTLKLPRPAQEVVLVESLGALAEVEDRVRRLESEMIWFAEHSAHAPVIKGLQALRGVSMVTALGIVAELGDISRFDRPERLMSYAGVVPSEYSSGSIQHRGSITRTGNKHLRWLLIESSWHYRHRPRVGEALKKRQEGLPEEVKRIAWKAQVWLSRKFRRLVAGGKPSTKAVVAVARELLGFIWAIAREVRVQQLTARLWLLSKNGAKEFLRREDGHGGSREVLDVSRDDASHSGGAARLVQHGILVVRKARVQCMNKDTVVDWSDLEHRQEFSDVFPRLPPTYGLGGKVVDRRDGSCTEHALDASPVGETEKLGRDSGERLSGKEHVEHHVCVEEDLHRCLASRWRL